MASIIRGNDNFDSAGGNAVKAWVNFNGQGTVAIRQSYNVTSITDNGTGEFTVNFTTAMPDTNYAMAGSSTSVSWWGGVDFRGSSYILTTSCRLAVHSDSSGGAFIDPDVVTCTFFR